jgi:hypothetical protein
MVLWVSHAGAQPPERLAVDSAVSISQWAGENAAASPDIIIDFTAAFRIGHGWQAYIRPWFRQPSTAPHDWDTTIYTAALQYERTGRVSTRVDLGYILSPIGIGMLDMRPDANPTIMAHMAYLIPMPSFDAGAPASLPIASSYPLGAQVTTSSRWWDLRTAVMTTPPNRRYVLYGATPNPAARPALVVGGGITPRTGLRVGAGYATGPYATAAEIAGPASAARSLHMFSAETEFAFGYTKLSAEFTHDTIDVASGTTTATEWFVQGLQTLSPRWFTAARHEGANGPASRITGGERSSLRMTELTAGYRVSNDFTVRASLASRKTYYSPEPDHQVGFSLVWARRWR